MGNDSGLDFVSAVKSFFTLFVQYPGFWMETPCMASCSAQYEDEDKDDVNHNQNIKDHNKDNNSKDHQEKKKKKTILGGGLVLIFLVSVLHKAT